MAMAPLVGCYDVEQFSPGVIIAPANAVSMSDRPVRASCDPGGLTGDAQGPHHARAGVGHGLGKSLYLPIFLQLLNAPEWACADDVECDPVVVVRAHLVLQARRCGRQGVHSPGSGSISHSQYQGGSDPGQPRRSAGIQLPKHWNGSSV